MRSHTRARRGAITLLAATLAMGAAACSSTASPAASTAASSSSGSGAGSSTPAGTGTSVEIKNFAFTPATLTVSVGTTVTWTNNDATSHSVKWLDGTTPGPTLSPGSTYSRTFTAAGTSKYICGIHGASMSGQVIVQ